MMPLWEGWDEYAHFAWLQHWNDHGTLPRTTDRLSREIDESLRLVPLSPELKWMGGPYLTHDEWWGLPAAEREERVRKLAALSPALAHQAATPVTAQPLAFYEAQQPPLYYWIAAAVMRPLEAWPLRDRVLPIRLLGVLMTSFAIPFTFFAARVAFGGESDSTRAVGCAALLAVAPGLAIDSARVANDGLAIALAALFLWLVSRERTHWAAVGTVLGAALLVKAYLLVLTPVLVVAWLRRSSHQTKPIALALALGFVIGGWWYVRNLMVGSPLTGWLISVPFSTLAASSAQLVRTGAWIGAAQTIAKSFTWFGGWSFLTLRSWMYTILEVTALAGMLASIRMRSARLLAPIAITVCFKIGRAHV